MHWPLDERFARQLWLSDKVSQVIVAAPIDDEHTVLYVRFYLRFAGQPALGRFAAYLSNLYNKRVVREDEAIIVSQRPKKADLDVGERFIPGDRPIALYLKRRRELIPAAQETDDASRQAWQPMHVAETA